MLESGTLTDFSGTQIFFQSDNSVCWTLQVFLKVVFGILLERILNSVKFRMVPLLNVIMQNVLLMHTSNFTPSPKLAISNLLDNWIDLRTETFAKLTYVKSTYSLKLKILKNFLTFLSPNAEWVSVPVTFLIPRTNYKNSTDSFNIIPSLFLRPTTFWSGQKLKKTFDFLPNVSFTFCWYNPYFNA